MRPTGRDTMVIACPTNTVTTAHGKLKWLTTIDIAVITCPTYHMMSARVSYFILSQNKIVLDRLCHAA
jgi:hypothetical protein